MPIRPEFRHFYSGPKWAAARARVLERSGNCCEACGKPNGALVFTYTWKTREPRFLGGWQFHMVWVSEEGPCSDAWRDQLGQRLDLERAGPWPYQGLPRRIRAQVGVAHADNNPANNDLANLHAWCNWCHLFHDQPFHRQTRSIRKDAGRPLLSTRAPLQGGKFDEAFVVGLMEALTVARTR